MPRDWENTERLKRMEKMLEDLTRQLNIHDRSVDLEETLDEEDYDSSTSEGATADITVCDPILQKRSIAPLRTLSLCLHKFHKLRCLRANA